MKLKRFARGGTAKMDVPGIHWALRELHFPTSMETALAAQRTIQVAGIARSQLALAMQRGSQELGSLAPAIELSGKVHARILNRLPHALIDQESGHQRDSSGYGSYRSNESAFARRCGKRQNAGGSVRHAVVCS
ncbi:MAG: hypothetical protein U0930_21180 [Pirellulales bacterium]